MRISLLCWLTSLVSLTQSQSLPNRCHEPCPSEASPVCGTDMRTYASRCHLQLAKCKGHKVKMIYKGRCKAPDNSPCRESRKRALERQKKSIPFSGYVPECDSDGSYQSVQCLQPSTSCWCVDASGTEIPATRVTNQRPACPTSPPKVSAAKSPWRFKHLSSYKGCPENVRASFNAEVINLLEREFLAYARRSSSDDSQSIAGRSGMGKVHLLMWKFNQLDTNADYFLEWSELHGFLRMSKKAIHPKKCSKTFVGYCDENQDQRISRNEWYACFGVQEIKRCIGEYLAALRSPQQSPSGQSYLPKCQSDGSFVPMQCYPAIGYCWCVDEQTGKHIPGTTKKTNSLDCTRYTMQNGPLRSGGAKKLKGKKECTSQIWPIYKRKLLHLFRKEVVDTKVIRRSPSGQLAASLRRNQRRSARSGNLVAWGTFLSDNQVLAWKFHQLDSNRDRIINSREFFVVSMKKMLGKIKRGRKCSRKLLADCDFDKDNGLSLNEWSYCLSNRYQVHLS
ncbi:SPARC-related modular calcium-binding protein 2 [Nematostella vectensis]|uniref:SPARC-related modular calcium-binding protein 2 n=1 Tax=Nematostella vectensis TaxID=45351 RepID=UPI00138FA780|nr:SPARC-related modular calcium-binding protein 2 [Nematostella vectensis]XP_032239760.1 SPARC-related modular calcium-binding protein 2 [Nematostella vectensis]XP_032239761.1 SPARC-related modular calcium-binding protein 2 [Nematostella vectensis]XP_048580183.1 SPARC-related modular calcium-binding protein 2 [Nematostella vectensis]XP_048580184.1 SPARC-related modular calcium-binding protein 2 [Nematostella vectensis]